MVKHLSILGSMALFLGTWFACAATAQDNPFELRPRLAPPAAVPADTANPFELLRQAPDATESEGAVEARRSVLPRLSSGRGEPLATRFLLLVTVLLMVALAILLSLFRPLIGKVFPALFNENQFNLLYRDQDGQSPWPFYLLYLFFFANLAFFLLQWLWPLGLRLSTRPAPDLLMLIAGVGLAFGLKHLLLRVLGYIFPLRPQLAQYSFAIRLYSIALGLLLLPVNLLLAFAPAELHTGLIYLVLGAVALAYLLRSLRGLVIAGSTAWSNKFHFLLYICTVEIAPVVVLAKLIINQL